MATLAASISNNMRKTLTNTSGLSADPHEVGSGEIRPMRALDPGLAFETSMIDHLNFLCYYGYKQKTIRSMSNNPNFLCPKSPAEELISGINYPTISIGRLSRHAGPRKIKRVVTNMGSSTSTDNVTTTYVASVNAPPGLMVKVVPEKIVFRRGVKTASFKVFFDGKEASNGYKFGDVTWSDGSHIVRVVFAVNSVV